MQDAGCKAQGAGCRAQGEGRRAQGSRRKETILMAEGGWKLVPQGGKMPFPCEKHMTLLWVEGNGTEMGQKRGGKWDGN